MDMLLKRGHLTPTQRRKVPIRYFVCTRICEGLKVLTACHIGLTSAYWSSLIITYARRASLRLASFSLYDRQSRLECVPPVTYLLLTNPSFISTLKLLNTFSSRGYPYPVEKTCCQLHKTLQEPSRLIRKNVASNYRLLFSSCSACIGTPVVTSFEMGQPVSKHSRGNGRETHCRCLKSIGEHPGFHALACGHVVLARCFEKCASNCVKIDDFNDFAPTFLDPSEDVEGAFVCPICLDKDSIAIAKEKKKDNDFVLAMGHPDAQTYHEMLLEFVDEQMKEYRQKRLGEGRTCQEGSIVQVYQRIVDKPDIDGRAKEKFQSEYHKLLGPALGIDRQGRGRSRSPEKRDQAVLEYRTRDEHRRRYKKPRLRPKCYVRRNLDVDSLATMIKEADFGDNQTDRDALASSLRRMKIEEKDALG
jgi:hypothetical protein